MDNVAVSDRFDPGLEQVDGQVSPIQRSLGRLEPGQSRQIAVSFFVRGTGKLCNTIEVSAPGAQFAQQTACVAVAQPRIVASPKLRVAKTASREARVGESVRFQIEVTNIGNVPLTNIRISDSYDTALQPTESTDGLDPDAAKRGEIVWVIPRMAPNETLYRLVLCTCR